MSGLIKTRSAGILRDEQPISASCPDQTSLHKAGSSTWAPLGSPIPQAPCIARANASIDNAMCSSHQQPWHIQNT
jgi:hypothetical protein